MHVVQLYLKWSNLPTESPLIQLTTGQTWTNHGRDGAALFIRFNATPGTPIPTQDGGRVITRFTADPLDPGVVSVFRNVSPFRVNLVLP